MQCTQCYFSLMNFISAPKTAQLYSHIHSLNKHLVSILQKAGSVLEAGAAMSNETYSLPCPEKFSAGVEEGHQSRWTATINYAQSVAETQKDNKIQQWRDTRRLSQVSMCWLDKQQDKETSGDLKKYVIFAKIFR